MPSRGPGRFRFLVVNVEQASAVELRSIARRVPTTDPILYCAAPRDGKKIKAGTRLHLVMADDDTPRSWEAVAQGLGRTHHVVGMILVSEANDQPPINGRGDGATTFAVGSNGEAATGDRASGAGPEIAALEQLTRMERRVLQLLADGLSTKQIAADLYVSPRTVESHRSQISSKLGIHSIAALTKFAVRTRVTTL